LRVSANTPAFRSLWSATGGARVFRQTVSQTQQTGLLFDGPGYISNEAQSGTWRKALWKANLAYRIDETNLVYATCLRASGAAR